MKTVTAILEKSTSPLAKLITKTKASQSLELVFRTILDPALILHCRFANYQDSTLTVTVPNPSWATRLRYAIPDIIKNLQVQPEFKTIRTIRYTISSQKQLPKTKNKKITLTGNNELLWKNTLAELKEKQNQRR